MYNKCRHVCTNTLTNTETYLKIPTYTRRRHEQAERDKKLWIIPRDDLQMVGSRFRSSLSIVSVHLISEVLYVCLFVCCTYRMFHDDALSLKYRSVDLNNSSERSIFGKGPKF